MDIYADPITVNCRKVLAGMKLMDVDFNLRKVDYFQAEQKGTSYTAINPNQSLPALKDGDFVLWESNAILQYAADKNNKTEHYPSDPAARADVNRWMMWEGSAWFPSCYVYLVENCVKPLLGDTPDQSVIDGEAENFNKLASILDARLEGRDWLVGNGPTLADIAIASPMHLHGWAKLPLDQHPNLVRWMTQSVEALPSWKATHIEEGFKIPDVA